MSEHRPLTRSRSKKFRRDAENPAELESAYLPPPLNIRKANASVPPQSQRYDVASIGVAVGSPRDSPLPPLPQQHQYSAEHFQFPFPTDEKPRPSTDESRGGRDSKQKGTRWKAFGSLFGRRDGSSRTEGMPSSKHPPVGQQMQHNQVKAVQASRKRAGSDKEKAMDQQEMTRRPSLIRRASSKRNATQRKKPGQARVERRSNRNSAVLGVNGVPRVGMRPNMARPRQDFSLLQISIPNGDMERYSIMFSHALQGTPNASKASLVRPSKHIEAEQPMRPRPGKSCTDSNTSLRGRDVLRDVGAKEGLDLPKPHRRDDSTSSTGSTGSKPPSFSLFPSISPTPGRGGPPARATANKPLPKPSPLSRSVTAPDTSQHLPRPPVKTIRSDEIIQPTPIAPGKENVPVSKWNLSHSRQSSHASTNNQDMTSDSQRPSSHGHVAQLSVDSNHRQSSHSRNPSLEPPEQGHSHQRSSASKYLDISEFSYNNSVLQGPAVRPQSPPQTATITSATETFKPTHTKQTFINRAFPARKSSLKRPHPATKPTLPHSASAPNAVASTTNITSPPSTLSPLSSHPTLSNTSEAEQSPRPPFARNANTTGSTDSIPNAEVSIARQISISRKQKQLLVPVVAKTARQPCQPLVVDGEIGGRRSELVLLEVASPTG